MGVLSRRNKKEGFDGTCLLVGAITFLNQFHKSNTDIFLGLLTQYINNTVNYMLLTKDSKQNSEIVPDLNTFIAFFEEFIRFKEDNMKVRK